MSNSERGGWLDTQIYVVGYCMANPFSRQWQNLCCLKLEFIIDWRVVKTRWKQNDREVFVTVRLSSVPQLTFGCDLISLWFQMCYILDTIIFWKVLKSEHPSSQNSPPLCPFSSTSNPPSSRPPLYKVPKKNYSSNLRICRFVSGTAAVFCHFLFAESIFFSCNTLSIKKSHYNSFTKQSLHSIETDNF